MLRTWIVALTVIAFSIGVGAGVGAGCRKTKKRSYSDDNPTISPTSHSEEPTPVEQPVPSTQPSPSPPSKPTPIRVLDQPPIVPPKPKPPADLSPTDEQIAAIVADFKVPPIHAADPEPKFDRAQFPRTMPQRYAADLPISDILKLEKQYPGRIAAWGVFDIVRKTWSINPKTKAPLLLTRIPGPLTEQTKKAVKESQGVVANAVARLEFKIEELDRLEKGRAAEPSRWQANELYALALSHARLAYLHEYDLVLGQVLKDELPQPEKGQASPGWRLVPIEKMRSKKDVVALAERSRELFGNLITEHPKTPWAVQAEIDKAVPLGLKWELIPAGK